MAITTRLLIALVLAIGCTGLPASEADRCEVHEDCRSGRTCEEGRCRDLADDQERPDASKPSPTAGTGGMMAASGRGGRGDMDAGMDSSVSKPDTGTSGGAGGATEGGAGAGGNDVAAAGADGSLPAPPDAEVDDDADTIDPDDDAGTEELPFVDSHPCGRSAPHFENVALWLSSNYGVRVDGEARVERWQDQSVHGHVALPVGDAPAWPIVVTPAEIGRPGVQFGPAGITPDVRRLRIADHSALQFADDFAIIAVLRYRNALVPTPMLTGTIYAKLCGNCSDVRGVAVFANDNWGLFTDQTPSRSGFTTQIGFYSNTFARTPQDGFNDNAVHIVVARRLGWVLSIAADRRAPAGVTDVGFVDVSTPGWDAVIGANAGAVDQVLDGELFELIAVPGQDAYDIDTLVDCLATAYAITEP